MHFLVQGFRCGCGMIRRHFVVLPWCLFLVQLFNTGYGRDDKLLSYFVVATQENYILNIKS